MTNCILLAVMASLIGPITMVAQTWVLEPQPGMGYNYPMTDGYAIIEDANTALYGVIDSTGKIIMTPQFTERPSFTTGQAVIQEFVDGQEEMQSVLLEINGRKSNLSENVDLSLGHNYFVQIFESPYDPDLPPQIVFRIFKIAQPELLKSGQASKELQLIPAFGDQYFTEISPFQNGLMLIDAEIDYFIRPDGSTAFSLPQSEYTHPFDGSGYTYYMDADSVHLINTKNQKVHSYPRDKYKNRDYSYHYNGDGYATLTSSFNEEWECFIVQLNSPNTIASLGQQPDHFPLAKEGRYWLIQHLSSNPDEGVLLLNTADGKTLKRINGYQIDSVHGVYTVMINENEMIVVDFNGDIIYKTSADEFWYGGDGYMWIVKDGKTGLMKFN
jgi:hypothetical protein